MKYENMLIHPTIVVTKSKWGYQIINDGKFLDRLITSSSQQLTNDELFFLVVNMTTVKTSSSVRNNRGLVFHQMDVRTAFVNGDINETVTKLFSTDVFIALYEVLWIKRLLEYFEIFLMPPIPVDYI